MSAVYSVASEESNSASKKKVSKPSGLLRTTIGAELFSRSIGPTLQSTGTSEKSILPSCRKSRSWGGGFPCKDISNAGTRTGITGKRSGLWKEFLRAIGEIRPKYAVVENVSALTFRGLLTVLGDLAEVGYDAEWNCIPASALGAPHRRDRIFIIAFPSDSQRKFGGSEHQELEGKKAWVEVAGSSSVVADSSGGGLEEQGLRQVHESVQSSKAMAYADGEEFSGSVKASVGKGQSEAKAGRGSCVVSDSDYYYYWQQCKARFREENRRTTWATDAGVLRVAHGIPHRVDRIKCLGNSVVPQVAQFIARQIKEREARQ